MSEDWFYLENGVQRGPVSSASLRAMLDGGAIPADSSVWRDGLAEWVSAGVALESAAVAEPMPPGITGVEQSAPRKINGWMIAWQVSTLIFLVPTVLGVSLWLWGVEGLLDQVVLLAACVATPVFVIAMFWRKRWAVFAFVAVLVLQLALLITSAFQGGMMGGPLAFLPPTACVLSLMLLFGALRLGGQHAGWSSFT